MFSSSTPVSQYPLSIFCCIILSPQKMPLLIWGFPQGRSLSTPGPQGQGLSTSALFICSLCSGKLFSWWGLSTDPLSSEPESPFSNLTIHPLSGYSKDWEDRLQIFPFGFTSDHKVQIGLNILKMKHRDISTAVHLFFQLFGLCTVSNPLCAVSSVGDAAGGTLWPRFLTSFCSDSANRYQGDRNTLL